MYFSAQTIAAVAVFGFGVLPASAVPTEDHSIAERSLFGNWWNTPQNLCDKPNYGAVGKPWDHNSKPGAWCGGQKPSNSGQWAQLVSSFAFEYHYCILICSLSGMVETLSSANLSSLDTA